MTEKEAMIIMKRCAELYDMEFTKGKFETWKVFLMQHGDYDRTMKKVDDRVLSGNQYRPVLAEIVAQEIKATEVQEVKIKERGEPTQAEIEEHRRLKEKIEKEIEEKGLGLNDL